MFSSTLTYSHVFDDLFITMMYFELDPLYEKLEVLTTFPFHREEYKSRHAVALS